MAGRTRLLSVEQGHDPRDFALVAFGGAGPLHGAAIMRDVGIRTMLVPPHPGVLCALGCAVADLRFDLTQTVERPVADLEPDAIQKVFERQREEGEAILARSATPVESVAIAHWAEMSYAGQIHSLRVPLDPAWSKQAIVRAFEDAYRREYGNTLGAIPTTVVGLKTAVQGIRTKPASAAAQELVEHAATPRGRRRVHFGAWLDCPIFSRDELRPGMHFSGPAIVEQADTTTVVEPGMTARIDPHANILMEIA
jgi:N-methylhydantoinase A